MLKAFMEEVIKHGRDAVVETEDKQFVLPEYKEISKSEPEVSTLSLKTLTGLVSYIKDGIDNKSIPCGAFVHVKNYNSVAFLSEIFGSEKQRECFVSSFFEDSTISRDWYEAEQFIINVNSIFKHTHGYEYLMKLVSGLSSSASKEIKDNGISQTAVVKTGITQIGEHEVKNPLCLQPFRTFPEIEQPLIDYVFRLREGRNNAPECALFPCDGGMWKLNTVHAIRDYLKAELSGTDVKIIA